MSCTDPATKAMRASEETRKLCFSLSHFTKHSLQINKCLVYIQKHNLYSLACKHHDKLPIISQHVLLVIRPVFTLAGGTEERLKSVQIWVKQFYACRHTQTWAYILADMFAAVYHNKCVLVKSSQQVVCSVEEAEMI